MNTIKEIRTAKANLEAEIKKMLENFQLLYNIYEIDVSYTNRKMEVDGEQYLVGSKIKITITI